MAAPSYSVLPGKDEVGSAPRSPQIIAVAHSDKAISWNLTLASIHYKCEIHMSTAFVTIAAQFVNNGITPSNCVLRMPMNSRCTATNCEIVVGNRIFETAVVPIEEVKNNDPTQPSLQKYDPEIFQLPFDNIQPNDIVNITFNYFEFLTFHNGDYRLELPMSFDSSMLPNEVSLAHLIQMDVIINTGTRNRQWGSSSHALTCISQTDTRIELKNDPSQLWANANFDLSYRIWHDTILSTALVEPPRQGDEEGRGSFAVFVTPPEVVEKSFPRRVIFILDRSGSMKGQPMQSAQNAVLHGVRNLNPQDTFSIIAFNEYQGYFSQSLVPASDVNKTAAEQWIQQVYADGLTDIMTPLKVAVSMLTSAGKEDAVPFVFLITDGAVRNEREICTWVQSIKTSVRINTFGIGLYCNHVFLKMLAITGRGFFDVAFKADQVYPQIVRMLSMAQQPVLTDIRLAIAKSAKNIELYPHPIPDLFHGCPLVLSGRYMDTFPQTITLLGKSVAGDIVQWDVDVRESVHIPLHKVFVKQRIDMLSGQAWLTESAKIKDQVVDLSVRESITSPYTVMVTYETNETRRREEAEARHRARRKYKMASALAIGGIAIVGVAVLTFGSIAASDLGFGLGDTFGGVDGCCGSGDGCGGDGCFGGCSDCGGGDCGGGDCGGGDCGDCGGADCDCSNCDCDCQC